MVQRLKTCVETHGIGNQKIPMAIIDDTVYMSAVFLEKLLNLLMKFIFNER